ncbi:hypothetical protein [Vibrio phage VCPH]|nr:hypothetical protein [Vibrio phage VCPH]
MSEVNKDVQDFLDTVTKAVSGASDTTVNPLRRQILAPENLLFPFLDKVTLKSGTILHPFIDVIAHDDTRFTVGGITLEKEIDYTQADMVDETSEDANPRVGLEAAMQNILAIRMIKQIERKLIDKLIADTTIHYTATINWDGIVDCIEDMGSAIYTVSGSIFVAVDLTNYLQIIRSDDYKNSKKELGDKIRLVVSDQLSNAQMLVFHEHGVAGGFEEKPIQRQRKPGIGTDQYVAAFTTAVGWNPNYVRFITP